MVVLDSVLGRALGGIGLAGLLVMAACAAALGQDPPPGESVNTPDEYLEIQLALEPAEAKRFWPALSEYRYEQAKLEGAHARLIDDTEARQATLSAPQAREFIDGWLDNAARRVKLTARFVKRVRRILPEQKVALLLLIEGGGGRAREEEISQ